MDAKLCVCQNCKSQFFIEFEDFAFYERMQVPAPTFCPGCRLQRRLAWRNERSLYRRPSDRSGRSIICLYSSNKPFKVYDQREWWADDWDAQGFGRDYNFNESFFRQFRALQEEVPRLSLFNTQCTNSEYTNQSYQNRNCYLCFSVTTSEESAYCVNIGDIKNSLDLLYVFKSELMYASIDSESCYRSAFLSNCESCIDSALLYDCRGCQNCIGGVGLRNRQYVFWGEQLGQAEYEAKKREFDLGSYSRVLEAQERLKKLIVDFPRRAARFKNCVVSTGDFLRDCKGAYSCFGAYDLENARHCVRAYGLKDVADGYGLGRAELAYETVGTEEVYNVKFTNVVDPSRNLTYCDLCFNSSDCFGCVGLRNKQHCVLNKQYSKEEYEVLVPKVIEQMNAMPYVDRRGIVYRFGEFFPAELSPFAYNETIAQDYFLLTKDVALTAGYAWKEPEERHYEFTKIAHDLPDHIRDSDDSILKDVIQCAHKGECNEGCTTAFRFIPSELEFYRSINVPLPRLCPTCRHYERLRARNPFRLWKRTCECEGQKSARYANSTLHTHGEGACANEVYTSYAPERPETVYCEACYQAEVS